MVAVFPRLSFVPERFRVRVPRGFRTPHTRLPLRWMRRPRPHDGVGAHRSPECWHEHHAKSPVLGACAIPGGLRLRRRVAPRSPLRRANYTVGTGRLASFSNGFCNRCFSQNRCARLGAGRVFRGRLFIRIRRKFIGRIGLIFADRWGGGFRGRCAAVGRDEVVKNLARP